MTTISINDSAFEAISNDVESIFQKGKRAQKTSQNYTETYRFLENKVTICFERVWIGQAAACGVDVKGSAVVSTSKKDPTLEARITELLRAPTYMTMAGVFPVIEKIEFKTLESLT